MLNRGGSKATGGTGRKLARKLQIRKGYEKEINTGHTRFFSCVADNRSSSTQEKSLEKDVGASSH